MCRFSPEFQTPSNHLFCRQILKRLQVSLPCTTKDFTSLLSGDCHGPPASVCNFDQMNAVLLCRLKEGRWENSTVTWLLLNLRQNPHHHQKKKDVCAEYGGTHTQLSNKLLHRDPGSRRFCEVTLSAGCMCVRVSVFKSQKNTICLLCTTSRQSRVGVWMEEEGASFMFPLAVR